MTWDYFCGEWLVWILIGFLFGPFITRQLESLFSRLLSFVYFRFEKNTAEKSLRVEMQVKEILEKKWPPTEER